MLRGFPRCEKNCSLPPSAVPNRLHVGMWGGLIGQDGHDAQTQVKGRHIVAIVGRGGRGGGVRARNPSRPGPVRTDQQDREGRGGEPPVTKKAIEVGRQKLADSLNPQPKLEPMKPIDEQTTILIPRDQLKR